MPHPLQPFQLPDAQGWAIDQERQRQVEAIYRFGEYAVFVLMWRIQDFKAGLVARCPTCYVSQGRVAEVFKQPSNAKCPDCFGTTFEGGYKARIIRPSLWTAPEPTQERRARGETQRASARVQTTFDFTPRTDDYVFRSDGTRWQIRSFGSDELHTGFRHASHARAGMNWLMPEVVMEDESSVAYMIPPDPTTLTSDVFDPVHTHFPVDYTAYEDVRGPLL